MRIIIDNRLPSNSLEKHRQEFPGLGNKVYFNFGGQGPLPRAGLEAIIDAHNYLQLHGPFSLKVNAWIQQKTEQLRERLARELKVPTQTLTLTENVTQGCNIALWGLDWQPGDHILMTDCEHPGVIAIIKELARRFGVQFSTCPISETLNQGEPLKVISQHLTPQTRLVVLSHLLWNTGQILPLREIVELCHHNSPTGKPILVLVDAAQSVGCLPLNLTELEADFYAFTGHKWLCGPVGVGGLYIRPAVFENISPVFIGWRGIEQDEQGNPRNWKNDGRRFEVATSAYPQYEGLRAAIAVHDDWATAEERYQQICQRSTELWEKLSSLKEVECLKTTPPEAGLVSFRVQSDLSHAQIVQRLEKQGFLLRTIASPNCIRACVHYLTLSAEVEQLVAAIKSHR